MDDVIRCPYCTEGGTFKAMMWRAEARWFLCSRCSHLAIPDNPDFKCRCPKCVDAERRTSPGPPPS